LASIESLSEVAPESSFQVRPGSSYCHFSDGFGLPPTVATNSAFSPGVVTTFGGATVTVGGTLTVNTASWLMTVPVSLLNTAR
jgi:hypothetical protein